MTDPDTMQALERIGRALARIEAVERTIAAPPAPPAEDAGLAARHDRLREHVQATIDRLDALIGESDG